MAYVRSSIAERGGTGRRLSRIQTELGLLDEECIAAFAEIEAAGDGVFDELDLIPFIYLVPIELAEQSDAPIRWAPPR